LLEEGRRNTLLSGFLIGTASALAILANPQYFQTASASAFLLFLAFGVIAYVANYYAQQFLVGAMVSAAAISLLLTSSQTMDYVKTVLAIPSLGVILVGMLIIGGFLIMRA
jgi:uncharacterized membrane protein (UPF0136 family)